jgi:formylglycine-generating enzyme required for sulfatase activity
VALWGTSDLASEPSPAPAHEWRLIAGKHWQIVGPRGEDAEKTDAAERSRGTCGAGMVEVRGRMKVAAQLDEMQDQACTSWITERPFPARCNGFDRHRWRSMAKGLPTTPMHFCIDRFEYPNRKNEYPIVFVSWQEASSLCAAEGKRLCSEAEWTFACEGEEARPYPYGYSRDPEACVIDRPWKPFNDAALVPRDGTSAMEELDRLWQGVPSGTRPRCKSPFGVYDMTGNVDEWARSVVPGERQSILKGGYWGPVRDRCRSSTRGHGEMHTFYQQGLRCCADAPGGEQLTMRTVR